MFVSCCIACSVVNFKLLSVNNFPDSWWTSCNPLTAVRKSPEAVEKSTHGPLILHCIYFLKSTFFFLHFFQRYIFYFLHKPILFILFIPLFSLGIRSCTLSKFRELFTHIVMMKIKFTVRSLAPLHDKPAWPWYKCKSSVLIISVHLGKLFDSF